MKKDKKQKQPSALKRAKTTASVATVAMALGGLIGVAIGLLNAPKKGKELKDDLMKDAEKLWKHLNLTKKQVEKMIEKTLGEVSPETLRVFSKAKSDILARVAKYKGEMTKKRFEEIVDAAVKRSTRSKKLQPKLKKLAKEFKGMWGSLSKKLK